MAKIKLSQPAHVEPNRVELLRTICYQSFPPEELTDFDEWLNQIAQGKKWLYIAEMDHTLLGFASILPCVAADVHLLETLAVGRDYRNQTVGAQLLQYAVKSVQAIGNASGIILEVESDECDKDRALRERRIAFYKRNGATIVECATHCRTPNAAGGLTKNTMAISCTFTS